MTFRAKKEEKYLLCSHRHTTVIAGPTCLIAHLLAPHDRAFSYHMSFWTGTPESTPIQTECMHGELGPNPQEDSLTSYTCYMMPCLFSDRLAFRMAFAQGVALVLECGWIKGLGRLFLQLLPLVLPINT